jgi:hypothetical protein
MTLDFEPQFAAELPETLTLIEAGGLIVHPGIRLITVHGSRGPAGGYQPDSDLDLCFVLDSEMKPSARLCREILTQTLSSWQGEVEIDLAVVFDKLGCGIECFNRQSFAEISCEGGGIGCLGLYKTQKGFTGFIDSYMIDVRQMYPYLTIWRRK